MQLVVGQRHIVSRTFTQRDYDRFAALSGDDNPIHVDLEFAAKTRFGRTLAHGMLLASVVNGELGSRFPGPGTLLLEQELRFPGPTYTGEAMELALEVVELLEGGTRVVIAAKLSRPDGSEALLGRLVVQPPTPAEGGRP